MDIKKMREEFEEWAADEAEVRGVGALLGLMTDEHQDRYSMIWTQTAWMAWQASRAALVIELPPVRPEPESSGDELKADGEVASWNIWVGEKLAKAACREAIEAAGLKVK